jgi:single-stranded-DNA-specific exonuclease
MQKRWNWLYAEEEKVKELQTQLRIHDALCRILVQRGIDNYDAARAYFRPQLNDLHSPWLMKDMDKAVSRIMQAFNRKEKILVFGDYDVDGTTSVACLFRFLSNVYDPSLLDFYIPHRYREGYGISEAGIHFARDNGYTLIISLDCGIKSANLIGYALELGIEFVVCDHHMPDQVLPPAVAILNPKQEDCPYPYKDLCGCGVGFKLICALTETLELAPEVSYDYLDLVATAIAADIVPLTGENRVLAFFGLKKANENPHPGIAALKKMSTLQKSMTISNLVFMIAPRVNAAGRMDDARKAVMLFLQNDERDAMAYAEQLHADNSDRREADASTTEEALAMIEADESHYSRKSTVVYQPHWHKGVVGIVASRLIDHYYRPTVVLTQSGDYVAGSARSISGFNLYEAVHECRDLLLGYGGHFFAAGLTLQEDNVAAFAARFEEVVNRRVTDDMMVPEIGINSDLQLKQITRSFYNIVHQMEPFGPDNHRPVFCSKAVWNTGWSKVVKEQHIKISVQQDGVRMDGIAFNLSHKFDLLLKKQPVDIIYTLAENEWNGEVKLQLKVLDIRAHETTGN